MRSQVALPMVCAVLGGAITAATLVATGAIGSGTTIMQPVAPLLSSPVGGTPAGDLYRREAAGVVAVSARTLPLSQTAFDVGDRRPDGTTTGSGFVYDDNGTIVTAAHIVRAAGNVRVEIDGRAVEAKVAGLDESSDIAVLRVDPGRVHLRPLPLGDSDTVQVGDQAIALGATPGLEPTLSAGTVSARQPRLAGADGTVVPDALQIDARLDGDDCGGPLLDASGSVIGINTRMLAPGGAGTLDFAVPANTVRAVLARLRSRSMKVVDG